MSQDHPITPADVARLAEAEAPDLVQTMLALLAQGDPSPEPGAPEDVITMEALVAALSQAARLRDRVQRKAQAHEAWKRYLAQSKDRLAPRLELADLVVSLYERRTGPSRNALLTLARSAPLVFGLWAGLKRVYKRAEADLDAEVFATLAARFDAAVSNYGQRGDVQRGTLIYLQRRAWRFLRLLGKATPELYPQFAAEVMRAYPAEVSFYAADIAQHIQSHAAPKWGGVVGLAKEKKFRAPYLAAWQRSEAPLMFLLETCHADFAASFAIQGLRELFPEVLRKVTPEWLGRLAYRPLASAHDFLVETLEGSPEFHQGKLKALGLHEAVLKLLVSPSARARKYAIEYARGHAADLSTERLVDLLGEAAAYKDTTEFAATLLMTRPARRLGPEMLGRLLRFNATRKWATLALDTEFERKELGEAFLLDMLLGGSVHGFLWAKAYIKKKYKPDELPLSFWMRAVDDPRLEKANDDTREYVVEELTRFPVGTAPGEWLLAALAREAIASDIGEWLSEAESLPRGIDLDRIKGLVFDPELRDVAFSLLGNKKVVSPRDVGLPWLLALARRADPRLHEWAHRYLLQHMRPEHFAEGRDDAKAGVARLFALALGPREPEAVRAFAQTYLRCHHPRVGADQPESKQLGIEPAIAREEYTEERVWPALFDTRADVRRFAVAVARAELRRWGAQSRVYELAESSAKEVRKVAYDALSEAGEAHADPDFALLPEELDAAQIFSMTESRMRSSRDVAIELIRKHYARIGGVERLGWLMQSADAEVRSFAVRLLWEKHRPRATPPGWQPPRGGAIEEAGAFTDAEALRDLLRRLLFTTPPTRSLESLDQARAKKLPASVTKRKLVEIVRDLGVRDVAFARLVLPLLEEFTGSIAKGEWQACLSALMTLRSVHGPAVEGGR
jgi:hypothetical protein